MGVSGRRVALGFALATFCCALSASASSAEGAVPNGKLTLDLPRSPAAGEAIHLRLTVGVLPRDARLVVRLGNGEIAGTVVPYGVPPNQKAGIYTIGIPARAAVKGKVSLLLEVKEEEDAPARPPTHSEVEGATLELVPVTRAGDEQ